MTAQTTETVESICRELAGRGFWLDDNPGTKWVPDKRFEVLRGEHDFIHESDDVDLCFACGQLKPCGGEGDGYCLRTDLGAIVRAAAACGNRVEIWKYSETWSAWVIGERIPKAPNIHHGRADTPELAAALALRAAVAV